MQRTYFGTPECGVFVKDRFPNKLKKLQRVTSMLPFDSDESVDPDYYKLWVCGSMNTNQNKMNELLQAIDPVNVGRVAGSGNKIVYMLDSMADYYINLVPGFKYWDMCASEALIEAKMGICVNADGRELRYDHNRTDFTVEGGIIIAKNMKVYQLVRNRVQTNLGMTLEQFYEEVKEETRKRHEKRKAEQELKAQIEAEKKVKEARA